MRLVAIELNPVDRQADWQDKVSRQIQDAVSVEIYTTDAHQGKDKTLHIMAIIDDGLII